VSGTAPGASGVSYTYTFTAATTSALDSVTMTVPADTGGTPVAGTVTPSPVAAGGSVSLAGGTLTYTFTPANTTTYPVAVDTAASSPPASTLYDASAGPGAGSITVSGSGAADPLGWSVLMPATAYAGSYTSIVTLTLAAGP
jgi:hypothetical protein